MARTVYLAAATLDGFIADDDDGIDWLTGYEPPPGTDISSDSALGSIDEFLEGIGALIMGSSTYGFLLDHSWPYGDRPTWVLTSRDLLEIDDAVLNFHDGPAADAQAAAAEAAGDKDVWLVGGGGIASDLHEAGLLDEVIVTIVPVLLGAGKRLFDRPIPTPMRLLGTRPFAGGMVELHYSVPPPPG